MSEMKNLRQHPIEHLRGVIPGIRPFPDTADVFAEPVEKYARHFLPLVTIDLALLDDAWSGPIHLVAPCEPYEGQVGEWGGEEFGNALLKPDWLAFKLNDQGRYELLGDWRYFMLEHDRADWAEKSLDWREVRTQHRELVKLGVEPPFELHHEAKHSWRDVMELHYATQHAAYEQARQDFLAHGWNAANEWDDPAEVAKLPLYEPGTDCYETSSGRYLLGVLGGPSWGGNWSNLTNELLSDTGTDDGIHPIHPETGAHFEFICSANADAFAASGTETLLFYEPESRTVLLTFDWS
ncbi:hypothetical protein [Comamonas sp. Tr-654]|uniref:hypothetical protein n=1 Tax=Comamonas sp. Tr-654 TaxID=2608341 RepID=UPI001F045831|nr:hypothetical protein [Comamonas sp. Tr-654]